MMALTSSWLKYSSFCRLAVARKRDGYPVAILSAKVLRLYLFPSRASAGLPYLHLHHCLLRVGAFGKVSQDKVS